MKRLKNIAPCIAMPLSLGLLFSALVVPCQAQNTLDRVIITLVAPGKAIDLNWLTNISINEDREPATLASENANACGTPPAAGCVH